MTLYNVFLKENLATIICKSNKDTDASDKYPKVWLGIIKAEDEPDLKCKLKECFPEYSTEDLDTVEIIDEITNFYEIRRRFHKEDAENHLYDYFDGMSDESILEIMHYDSWDALLSDLAESYESVKDCNLPDNEVWTAVIENYVNDAS